MPSITRPPGMSMDPADGLARSKRMAEHPPDAPGAVVVVLVCARAGRLPMPRVAAMANGPTNPKRAKKDLDISWCVPFPFRMCGVVIPAGGSTHIHSVAGRCFRTVKLRLRIRD